MSYTPSKYQKAIFEFIETGSGNAVINAVAGSGKSSTLVDSLKKIDSSKSVLFLAFNKSIVEELKIKVGKMPNVTIKTLHSLGASVVNRSLWAVETKATKYTAYINSLLHNDAEGSLTEGVTKGDLKEFKSNIFALIDLCRSNLTKTKEEAKELAAKHGLILRGQEIAMAFKAIKWGLEKEDEIDFTDMLTFPLVKGMKLTYFDYVFIDECQDLNAAQRELFLKCIKPETGRFIAVGDPQQAIYGFAGADSKSFKLLQDLPNTVTMPLSVCYRCDASIIKMAQSIVPHIECRDGAPEGVVDHKAELSMVADGDMILCRLTAPLVDVCLRYIQQGIKAYIKGGDIGAGLVKLIEDTAVFKTNDILVRLGLRLYSVAADHAKANKCTLTKAQESEAYTRLADRIKAVEILSEGLENGAEISARIRSIFAESAQGICLSSIHRSKGLECPRVFILCPGLLWHPRSMQQQWTAEQEDNLVYVAYTRAKNYLGFIKDYAAE